MNTNKAVAAAVLATAVAAPIVAYEAGGVAGDDAPESIAAWGSPRSGLASLDGATQWINSPPLTAAALRGKVVVVDFWTYSCINWRRQLPYVRAWADKYRDQGLVVIGVHTPEFAFEKDLAGIRDATSYMDVRYPVVVDSDYRIWNAFGNQYWPALYFIDAKGIVRHTRFGEGEYPESEKVIQKLLAEAGNAAVARDVVAVQGRGLEAPPDFADLRSAEAYIGSDRRASSVRVSGSWKVEGQFALSTGADARISQRFHARDVHLVMGPHDKPVRFRILLDGKPPGADHGDDVDEQGNGTATKRALYQLVRQKGPVRDRTFEIQFLDAGAEAYSFTFG